MNKPSWETAPSWAEWLVMQPDGSWWWFEGNPRIVDHGLGDEWAHAGRAKCATEPTLDWRDTKEGRA
jgi:hypothetical protein